MCWYLWGGAAAADIWPYWRGASRKDSGHTWQKIDCCHKGASVQKRMWTPALTRFRQHLFKWKASMWAVGLCTRLRCHGWQVICFLNQINCGERLSHHCQDKFCYEGREVWWREKINFWEAQSVQKNRKLYCGVSLSGCCGHGVV